MSDFLFFGKARKIKKDVNILLSDNGKESPMMEDSGRIFF